MFRQGDVIIFEAPEGTRIPPAWKSVPRQNGRVILAYGEKTGHHHSIATADVELFAPGEAAEMVDRMLRTGSGAAAVEHQEHGAITTRSLKPNTVYIVRPQREHFPEAVRQVAD